MTNETVTTWREVIVFTTVLAVAMGTLAEIGLIAYPAWLAAFVAVFLGPLFLLFIRGEIPTTYQVDS